MDNNNTTVNKSESEQKRDFRTYARILLKYAPLIIGITIATTVIAFIYSVTATEIYQAKVMLRIERENIKAIPGLNSSFYNNSRDFDFFQTQIKLFRSRSLVKSTLIELANQKIQFEPGNTISEEKRISDFLKKITIKPEPRSQLVFLCVEDENKRNAMIYANTLAKTYIKQAVGNKMDTIKHYGEWFEGQAKTHENVVLEREKEFREFRKKHNVVELHVEMADNKDSLKRLQQKKIDIDDKITDGVNLDEVKKFQFEQEKEQINEEITQLKKRMSELDTLSVQYESYEQRLQAARDYYTLLLKRAEEWTSSKKEFDPRNISIIDEAEEPARPIKPQKTVNVLFGMIFGMVLGIGIAFFVEYLDDTIKSPTDVENFLNVPFLGLIPTVSKSQASAAVEGIVETQPKGTIAESYRAIRTNILFSSDRPVSRLVVTSAGPSEGKTTTAINIAEVMARAGDKTLLIDGDMRRPRIHKITNIDANAKGLSNYLIGNASAAEVIHKTQIDTLLVMPAGPIPPNPVELLNNPRLKELIVELSDQYDRIIIDTPPVIAVTDAAILARLVDGVVFTVHGGRAHRDIVKRGVTGLRKVGGHVFGVILNNVNIYRASYYDYYYYNYYRYAYGYGYGYRKNEDKKKDKKPRKRKKEKSSEI